MNLITTMASGWYRGFIPLFEYTAKKFNPDCHVRVFDKDTFFPNHADNATGLLRFCIPNALLKDYEYVYFTDIDFIFLPHKTSLLDYHIGILKRTKQIYAGHRGPTRMPWVGKKSRLAGGAFLVTQEWLTKTETTRKKYANRFANGVKYREQDEVCLQRMTVHAGCNIPETRGCFVNGEKYDKTYRNLHLGDFKSGFSHRWTDLHKMRRRFFLDKSVEKYRVLAKDSEYSALVGEAIKTPEIAKIYNHLNLHLSRRS